MVIFRKKKWVDEYLADLRRDPVAHSDKYDRGKIPLNVRVEDVVRRVPIEEIDGYLMPKHLVENKSADYGIFTRNSAGDYCSFYRGGRGEGTHYKESPDPKEGFRQYIRCLFDMADAD